MGLFSGVGGAGRVSDGNYLNHEGNYLVRIDKVKAFKNRSKQDRVGIEMTILKDLGDPREPDDPVRHSAGEQVSQVLVPTSDYFLKEVTAFVEIGMRCDFSQMSDEECEAACESIVGEDQPLAGAIMRVTAQVVPKARGEGSYTRVRWREEVDPRKIGEYLTEAELAKRYPADAMESLTMLQEIREAMESDE